MSMKLVLGVSVLMIAAFLAAQDKQSPPGSLTIEDVLQLSSAHVGDDIIVARVKRNAKPFDLNADEIVALRKAGVSEIVIKYLTDPTLPYPPPGAPAGAPAAAPSKPVLDPLALKVPSEAGIYYLSSEQDFAPLDLKQVVPYKQPGKIPFLKGHVIGSVIGPLAKTRILSGSATFFVRLADKASIDDLTLLSLEKAKDRRNLDFGPKPGKPVFPVSSVKQFETKEVATGIFRVTAPLESSGEYIFLILGSADDKKGLLGRGYDFGVN